MNRIVASVAAAILLLFSAWQAPAQDLLDYVPGDSEVVAAFNVADIANRPAFQEVWRTEVQEGSVGPGVRMVERLIGIDVTTDIDTVIIAGQVDRDEMGMAIIKATFDEQAILDVVRMNPGYNTVELDGKTLHRWTDGEEKCGVFLPDGVVLVSNSEARVRQALVASTSNSASFANNHGSEVPSTADAWVWLRRPERPGTDMGNGMRMIGLAGTMTRLNFESNEVVLETAFDMDRPEDITDHRVVLDGLLAVGRLQQQQASVGELARMTKTDVRDGRPVLITRVPNADFTRLVRTANPQNR